MARRLDIQAYRAMAIASVLLFHADPEIFPNGYLGVDLFFVISGFVMAPQIIELSGLKTSDRFQNFFKFIKRRFFRLYPALAAICLISIPLVFLFGVFQDFSRSVNQAAFTFFLAGNHGAEFFSGEYFSQNRPNPFVHTWSLAVEEQFYLLIPILYLMNKKGATLKLPLLVISFSLIYFVLGSPSFYSTMARLWEFAIGIVAFQKSSKEGSKFSFLLLLLLLTIFLFPLNIDLSIATILVVATSALLLQKTNSFIFMESKPIQWIGDRSYSLYLWHMPLIYIAKYTPLISSESKKLTTLVALLITFLLSDITYRLFERPFSARSRKNLSSGTRRSTNLRLRNLSILSVSTITISLSLQFSPQLMEYLADSKKGYAGTYDDKCNFVDSPLPCQVEPGSKNGERVLLIGDSHAGALSEVFTNIVSKEKYEALVWVTGGCSLRFTNLELGDSCNKQNIKKRNWITSNPGIQIVLVNRFYLDKTNSTNSQKQFISDLNFLIGLKNRVLIVGPNPEMLHNVYFYNSVILDAPLNFPKQLRKSEMESLPLKNDAFLKNNSLMLGYNYLSIVDELCDLDSCVIGDSMGWNYVDRDHLSNIGAKALGPKLKESLGL